MKLLLCTCVLAILCQHGLLAGRVSEQLRVFGNSQANNGQQRVMMEEVNQSCTSDKEYFVKVFTFT